MDRSQWLPIALLAAGLSAGQLGCEGDSSGEYRTYTEAEAALAPPDGAEVSRSFAAPGAPSISEEPSEPSAQPDLTVAAETVPLTKPLDVIPPDWPTDAPLAFDIQPGPADQEPETRPAPASSATEPSTQPAKPSDAASESGAAGVDLSNALASLGSAVPGSIDPVAAESLAGLAAGPIEPRTIELLVPEKTFNAEGPQDALRISYDDLDLLKVLNMEPIPEDAVNYFPQWLSGLDGRRIRVRGFMYPAFQESGLTGFVLARDNQICCFGRNPKIYDLIEVSLRDGVTTDYIQGRPFDVVGMFHIRPDADQGELYQLYQIDDAVVVDR